MNEETEKQRKTWNQFSVGWKKWDEILMRAMKPTGDALVDTLNLKGTEHVLDIASGTGEPGLTLAGKLPQSTVIGTDLSEEMVLIANDFAQDRNITNYKSQVSDAASLRYDDNYFDAIICRFGIMFIPDMPGGLREMRRVMKPRGKIAAAVWATPDKNPFITVLGMTVMQKLNLPKPSSEAPGIFRCAQPGMAKKLLEDTSFNSVTERIVTGEAVFDSPQNYWEVMSSIAGPVMQALNNESKEVIDDVRAAVLEKANNHVKDGNVRLDWESIIVSGDK